MNKPKIRFKGYEDDWEQRKLGELAEKTYGGGTPKTSEEEFWNGNIPWFQSADLTEHEVQSAMPKKGITEIGLQKSAAQLIPGNSIAIVTRVGVGKIVFMPFPYATSQDFLSLSELKNDEKFVCYAIYKLLQREKNLTQGTSIKGITKEELLNKKIDIPNREEQKKIGKYFTNLDHLITLHQRKCEETKTLKKYMLQKMFPQNGTNVPEIRFDGFTDAWEQRKLSEIALEKLSNGIMNKQSSEDTGLKHINVLNMYEPDKIHTEDLTFSDYGDDAVKKCNVEVGDIFMTRSSLKPEGIAEANVLLDSGRFVYDDHLIRLKVNKEKYEPLFVKIGLTGTVLKRQFIIRAKTTAFTTIGQEDIAECVGYYPSLGEQQKIAGYFQALDDLITLHQRKCDELVKIKKYMLQNMFV